MKKTVKYILLPALAAGILACTDNEVDRNDYVYKDEDDEQTVTLPARKVEAMDHNSVWGTYEAITVDRVPGYTPTAEPERDIYGGWDVGGFTATGFFHTEMKDGRWWIVDPLGNPYINAGVAVFKPVISPTTNAALAARYGDEATWAAAEAAQLREHGFNGFGAWSRSHLLKGKEPYTVLVSPMTSLRSSLPGYGQDASVSMGWQGFENDIIMVFHPDFDAHVTRTVQELSQWQGDPYFLGFYSDNELPWVNDALDRFLTRKGSANSGWEYGYDHVWDWFRTRKGNPSATTSDITQSDRDAFSAYYMEAYMSKIKAAAEIYAPDHMYLGTRFNQQDQELNNQPLMAEAGKYADIISVNHYRLWQPDRDRMNNWINWSGTPFIVTEFYVKGVDSGMQNESGAGWLVNTQADRSYFYQNFTMELLKSKGCVGWHWFRYMDNDPEDVDGDSSNLDANKGIVDTEFNHYTDLWDLMKELNTNIYRLIQHFDK
ncbi:MAG: hypothetical protein LIO85_02820 [Rikenellaceae bacterium]|nr:hypothetical protein [Rikenellaceae bacterium]